MTKLEKYRLYLMFYLGLYATTMISILFSLEDWHLVLEISILLVSQHLVALVGIIFDRGIVVRSR